MNNPIQVMGRAFAMLEFVAETQNDERSLSEIAAATGLKLPTAARIAQTLVQYGYLEQKSKKKGYSLGWKAYSLTGSPETYQWLIDIARPALWKFYEATGEYIAISTLHNGVRIILDYILPRATIWTRHATKESPFLSYSGRMMLAWLPEERQRRLYRANGNVKNEWELADSEDDCIAELAAIRKKNRIYGEQHSLSSVAIPIMDSGKCAAMIGSYMESHRYVGEIPAKIDAELLRAKASIERKLAARAAETADGGQSSPFIGKVARNADGEHAVRH